MKILILGFVLLLGACSNHALTVGLGKNSSYAMTKTFQSAMEQNKKGFTSVGLSKYFTDETTSPSDYTRATQGEGRRRHEGGDTERRGGESRI